MAATKLVSNYQEIVKVLAPFFTAQLHFKSASGDYGCCLCGDTVKANDKNLAISYGASRYGTWAHTPCVKQAKATVSDNNDAKVKAKKSAVNTAHKQRTQGKPAQDKTTTSTVDRDAIVKQVSAEIELVYDETITQALAVIEQLKDENARLRLLVEQREAVAA